MVPETVSFTDLEISPKELVTARVHSGPFPATWTRVACPYSGPMSGRAIHGWVMDNIEGDGRFGVIVTHPLAVLYFERETDAVMFRMLDGAAALKELR